MKYTDFDTNKNAFHETVKIIVDWLGFMSKRWSNITDKNKFIEQNLQPLLTGEFREPKIKDGDLNWPSPALGTFLRYLGLINDSYEISPLCKLLIDDLITLPEYSIIILSKQRGFLDEIPRVNFLPLLCLYIRNKNYQEITKDDIKYLSQVKGYNLVYDSTNKDENRDDIIFNSVKMTGLFDDQSQKLTLKVNAKSIIDFIADNHLKIDIDERVDKKDKYNYYGDLESGIFKLKGLDFPEEWYSFYPNIIQNKSQKREYLNISSFEDCCLKAGLIFSSELIQRFVASLCTKPFVICSGLSGSGKTKLAQAFVQWICESDNQYEIISVGADWTNREPLLGYPNGITPDFYVTPDSGALQLILEASINEKKPYFMILDEMNLSHVERYFADFLSIMESGGTIKLYSGVDRKDSNGLKIPQNIIWPKNLFIIGTVNIDETTYMFSPKVLDRANVIEFRITNTEMEYYFDNKKALKMEELYLNKDKNSGGAGQYMGENFITLSLNKSISAIPETQGKNNILNKFFTELQIVGCEFGYRSAFEIELLITKLGIKGFKDDKGEPLKNDTKIDIAIMQKLLPKLHGSRKKLVGPLETLAGFCLARIQGSQPDEQNKLKTLYQQFISEKRDFEKWEVKYPVSFGKIERMLKNVIENGFTSYAEA